MGGDVRSRRARGGVTVGAGLLSVAEVGGFTLLWVFGVFDVPADAPPTPSGFVAVNAVATVVLVAGVVLRLLRASRALVLGAALGVIAVLGWLVFNLVTASSESALPPVLSGLFALWVAAFAAGLLHYGLDRTPRTSSTTDDQARTR